MLKVKLPKKRSDLYLVLEAKRSSNAGGRHRSKDDPKLSRKIIKVVLKKGSLDE